MPSAVGMRARFGGFAWGHLLASWIGLCITLFFPALVGTLWHTLVWPSEWATWGLSVLIMLIYVPIGSCAARKRGWTRPGWREGVGAVLLPALVAWAFAVPLLAVVVLDRGEVAGCFAALSLITTVFWANPSFCLMLWSMSLTRGMVWFSVFLAGLLPPLLFHLGAVLGAKAVDNGGNCDILT